MFSDQHSKPATAMAGGEPEVAVSSAAKSSSGGRLWFVGLSARLLGLTVAFVLLAEVLIFFPSFGNSLRVALVERIRDADVTIALLEESPSPSIGQTTERILLEHTNAEFIARTGDGASRAVFVTPPREFALSYDFGDNTDWSLILKALEIIFITEEDALFRVSGGSQIQEGLTIEMLLRVAPLRAELLAFGRTVIILSLLISLVTATLVYLALNWIIVRPVRQLTHAMAEFARKPLSSFGHLEAQNRTDEVGEASLALISMRQTVRNSLVQNQRLASLGTGVAQINHDLRNLLGTALLLSEQLESSHDDKVRQKMPKITQSIEAAAELCRQTLSFAREGSVVLRKQAYRADALMTEIDLLVSPKFPQVDVEVTLPILDESDLTLGLLQVDIIHMDRVLVNLVTNAVQAGAVSIWLDAEQDLVGNWHLVLSDDGPGFPGQALDGLFEPFAASTKKDGTGLGLYNAREVLRAHGGDLVLRDPGPATGGALTTFVLSFEDERLLGKRH